MPLIEKDFTLEPDANLNVIKFDDPHTHGLTSYDMKAVDFIIEFPDKYVFLEIKDPDDPMARSKNREIFYNDFKSDTLRKSLVKKYRDSFIYRWAQKKTDKPIYYYVLISFSKLKSPDYIALSDLLRKYLPCKYEQTWKRNLASNCRVVSIKTWNKSFPECQIKRISLGSQSLY